MYIKTNENDKKNIKALIWMVWPVLTSHVDRHTNIERGKHLLVSVIDDWTTNNNEGQKQIKIIMIIKINMLSHFNFKKLTIESVARNPDRKFLIQSIYSICPSAWHRDRAEHKHISREVFILTTDNLRTVLLLFQWKEIWNKNIITFLDFK